MREKERVGESVKKVGVSVCVCVVVSVSVVKGSINWFERKVGPEGGSPK